MKWSQYWKCRYTVRRMYGNCSKYSSEFSRVKAKFSREYVFNRFNDHSKKAKNHLK